MKYDILAIIVSVLVPVFASAQESNVAEGSPSLSFVTLNPDVAAEGMGAYLASTSSVSFASFSNAAAIPFYKDQFDISAGGRLRDNGSTRYFNLGASWNVAGCFGVTAGVSAGFRDGIDFSDESGNLSDTFNPMDLQFNAGFAWRFIDWMSAGLNVRYATQSLAPGYSLSAFLMDAFLMGRFDDLCVTAGVSNVGTDASFGSSSGIDASYPVPSSFAAGLAYSPVFGEHALSVNADARYYLGGYGVSAAVGASYTWRERVIVRTGYVYGGKFESSRVNFGLGYDFGGFVRLDAAFSVASENSAGLSLSFSF